VEVLIASSQSMIFFSIFDLPGRTPTLHPQFKVMGLSKPVILAESTKIELDRKKRR
jgi:hypothetical protein